MCEEEIPHPAFARVAREELRVDSDMDVDARGGWKALLCGCSPGVGS
jgi:hypothetical protein